ncbi:SRPBCC family protein [Streptomyces sp. WAC08241]|uniref:SRPBCC family protein n=1 Tax=Streptomyces sp. WAC08241 TaxID=2487421 RepID=UPI000F7898C9|nr:SRPBCC family protein [Streptomyces sp. WAC08241]
MTGTGTDGTAVVVERRVAASPGRVWEAITDLPGLPRVLTGVRKVEVLTPGGFGVGTRWRETRRMLGREATEEMTVTACEPPDRYVTVADSHGMHYVSELTLTPDGTGSAPGGTVTTPGGTGTIPGGTGTNPGGTGSIPGGTASTVLRMTFSARPAHGRSPGVLGRLLARFGAKAVARALAKDLADIANAVETRA